MGSHRRRWEPLISLGAHIKTKVWEPMHQQLQEPLVDAVLLLGVMILVLPRLLLPRLLLPPQPSQLTPMVAEFGLVALRISVIHHQLSQHYAVITLDQYERLTPGMHLSAVESIVGTGSEIKTQQFPHGAIAITYEWINPDGSRLIATFQAMKLTGKAQAGLK